MPRTRTHGGGLDKDTIAFAARVKAGSGRIILTEPLKQINKFVIGAKKLGLWDSIVCWPMRSIHNAGTGSTVYSLGGLGTYNGTLINGPTWGRDGLFFLPNRTVNLMTYLNFPYKAGQYGVSVFSIVNPLNWITSGSGDILLLGAASGNAPPMLHLTNGVAGGTSMVLQKFAINYNNATYGAGYVNNYMRLFGSTSVNTQYYKSNYFYAGYSPSLTAQDCLFVVDKVSRLNTTSYQPVNSFGVLPAASTLLRAGINSASVTNNAIITLTGLCNIAMTSNQHELLRKLINTTICKNIRFPY
jgi:hypothetical protein